MVRSTMTVMRMMLKRVKRLTIMTRKGTMMRKAMGKRQKKKMGRIMTTMKMTTKMGMRASLKRSQTGSKRS